MNNKNFGRTKNRGVHLSLPDAPVGIKLIVLSRLYTRRLILNLFLVKE